MYARNIDIKEGRVIEAVIKAEKEFNSLKLILKLKDKQTQEVLLSLDA